MTQIHWINPVDGNFQSGANWSGGKSPGGHDAAIFDAPGSVDYTVTWAIPPNSRTVAAIQLSANAVLDINTGLFYAKTGSYGATDTSFNAGLITVRNGSGFRIRGPFDNSGSIDLLAADSPTSVIVWDAVTLTGGGTISFGSSPRTRIYANPGGILTNVDNTLEGGGRVGLARLTMINEAGGVIDANNGFLAMVVDATLTNAGLIEATGVAGLTLAGSVDDSGGGLIKAGNGSAVRLTGEVTGGVLKTEGSGLLLGQGGVLNAVEIEGALTVNDAQTITLAGAIGNDGQIKLASKSSSLTPTELVLGGDVTLGGHGVVEFAGGSGDLVSGGAGYVLTNLDNTIEGGGTLGDAGLTLVNDADGVIDTLAPGESLTIDTGGATIVNAGLIEAAPKGVLLIQSAIDNTGTLLAAANSTLTVEGAVTGAGTANLTNATLQFDGAFDEDVTFGGDGGVLILGDSQGYGGTIADLPAAAVDVLDLRDIAFGADTTASYDGDATGGVLTVTDGTHTATIALTGDFTHTDFVATSDQAAGVYITTRPSGIRWSSAVSGDFADPANWSGDAVPGVGDTAFLDAPGTTAYVVTASTSEAVFSLSLDQTATLTVTGGVFTIGDKTGGGGVNDGFVEVENGATLALNGSIDSTHGMIEAFGAGAVVELDTPYSAGAAIKGGFLVTFDGAVFEASPELPLLDGVRLEGEVDVPAGAGLILAGTIQNLPGSVIKLAGAPDAPARLIVNQAGGVTLTQGGTISLTGPGAEIKTFGDSGTFINQDNIIEGAGTATGLTLELVNEAAGEISARNGVLYLGGLNTFENAGLIDSKDGGRLVVDFWYDFENDGVIEADTGSVEVKSTKAAVIGTGHGLIEAGTLTFDGAFTQNVTFAGLTGTLALAQSQGYTGTISGFSTLGGNELDLEDIGFVSATEATFGGDASGGVLTVSDGTHTAAIKLAGDYTGATFTAAGDGASGVVITASAPIDDVHWAKAVSGDFATASNWTGGAAPLAADRAFLDAKGADYTVDVTSNARVLRLDLAANATLEVKHGVFAADATVVNAGSIAIDAGATFATGGMTDNAGVIDVIDSTLELGGDTQLTGGGAIVLANGPANNNSSIIEATTQVTLTNVDNTISGDGAIDLDQITLINDAGGAIKADTSNSEIELKGSGTVTNAGLMEASGGGGLGIVGVTVDQSKGGVILSRSKGGVGLYSTTIIGGALETTCGGQLAALYVTLDGDGSPVTVTGIVEVVSINPTVNTMTIEGSIVVGGAIAFEGGSRPPGWSNTFLSVAAGGATLSGGGSVTLAGALSAIEGVTASATLTNLDVTISGSGEIGEGALTLIEGAAAVIDASGPSVLAIDTGAKTLVNAGLIEATGAGGGSIAGAVKNSGTLMADGGDLTVGGAVTGAGAAVVDGGTLAFLAAFNEDVTFGSGGGVLQLGRSQTYGGTISGFADGEALDLEDIAYGVSTKATFSGDASGGVVTVTDGSHTANIHLAGDYTDTAFSIAGGGGGVVLSVGGHAIPAFAQAMAATVSGASATVASASAAPASQPVRLMVGRG